MDEDEVHVWVVRVRDGSRAEALSLEERRRADAFRREEDRRRYVAQRQALREILASYVGVPPAEIVFSTTCLRCGHPVHGKPRLDRPAGTGVTYSASRSGDVALVAVARGREVGVDVERADAEHAWRDIAPRIFPGGLPAGLDARGFYRAWARKEAVLKLTGEGLAGDLAAPEPADAWIAPLDVPEGYAAALAVEGGPCRVRVRDWV